MGPYRARDDDFGSFLQVMSKLAVKWTRLGSQLCEEVGSIKAWMQDDRQEACVGIILCIYFCVLFSWGGEMARHVFLSNGYGRRRFLGE